jgi:NAD(P)-dependent dehydrogenase (short-subunit alcohol dehydrogenase family)
MATKVLASELARWNVNVITVSMSVIEDTPAMEWIREESPVAPVFEMAIDDRSFPSLRRTSSRPYCSCSGAPVLDRSRDNSSASTAATRFLDDVGSQRSPLPGRVGERAKEHTVPHELRYFTSE